jgi:flagellar protein FliS
MLYDGAIAAMQRAVSAIEAYDIPKKCTHLNRAQAIIMQLEGTLNFELGGEVAQTLKALYVYARAQMLKANIENSAETLRSLIDKLSTVREAWYEADHRPTTAPPASPSISPSTPRSDEYPHASSPTPEPGSWRLSG